MKKYFLFAALSLSAMAFSQNYPYGYPDNSSYGQSYGYGYPDDLFGSDFYNYAYNNFPDDYFYQYPADYYPSGYYQSYYNDYRNSIVSINWNQLFSQFRISPAQIRLVLQLNNRFSNFGEWNRFYGQNPDRWYYDRYYALERILGPQIILVIQNQYYGGYSPVVYFRNYRQTYYRPRYTVVPKYRNININTYRVNRDRFFVDNNRRANTGSWNNNRNVIPGSRERNQVNGNQRFGTPQNERRESRDSGFRTAPQAIPETRSPRISGNENGWRQAERRSAEPNRSFENRGSSPAPSHSEGSRSSGRSSGFRGF